MGRGMPGDVHAIGVGEHGRIMVAPTISSKTKSPALMATPSMSRSVRAYRTIAPPARRDVRSVFFDGFRNKIGIIERQRTKRYDRLVARPYAETCPGSASASGGGDRSSRLGSARVDPD
jgi:hypothetical protein